MKTLRMWQLCLLCLTAFSAVLATELRVAADQCCPFETPVCACGKCRTGEEAARIDCAVIGNGPENCCADDCICTEEFDPVCGVDGVTYSNACKAKCAGVEVKSEGECETEPKECCPADKPVCCGGSCITTELARVASCVAGGDCCATPQPPSCCHGDTPVCCGTQCITRAEAAVRLCAGAQCCAQELPILPPTACCPSGKSCCGTKCVRTKFWKSIDKCQTAPHNCCRIRPIG